MINLCFGINLFFDKISVRLRGGGCTFSTNDVKAVLWLLGVSFVDFCPYFDCLEGGFILPGMRCISNCGPYVIIILCMCIYVLKSNAT